MRHLLHVTLVLLVASLGLANPAAATVISGSSSSFATFIDLSGLVNVDHGPTVVSSGTAPGPYADSDSLLTLSVPPVLSTGLLQTTADSNVDGLDGTRSASASAEVNDITVGLVLGLTSVLSLVSGEIDSDASVSGNGALVATGSSNLVGASISVLGGAAIPIPISPAANTTLIDLLGVKVVLNEQIFTGDGVTSSGITVNAIHIYLTNVLGLENGDIIISQSKAQLNAVPIPEPSTAVLLGVGLAMFAVRARRHRAAH